MNQVSANIRPNPFNKISAAEQKRASRFKPSQKDDATKSDRPFRALNMQRALSPVSYDQRSSVKQSIADLDSFNHFDLLPAIREAVVSQALHGLADISPTPIQRLAIPALMGTDSRKRRQKVMSDEDSQMSQFLLAAETGSGKTLAYLLPIIDAIKRQEVSDAERNAAEAARKETEKKRSGNLFELDAPPLSNDPHPTTGRPRAIILLPTAELVSQVGAVVKSLSHTVKFRSAMVSAAFSGTVIRNRLFSPSGIDVLISTPHLLSSISDSDPNVLSRVTHLVMDEADSLLDRSFAPTTGSILDRATPSLKQLVLCSATIPRSLDSYLRKRYPDVQRLATPNLHAIPRRVLMSVVDVEKDPYKNNKDLACADTIWTIGRAAASESPEESHETVKRIIVFVNEREKTVELADYLQTKGIDATALNRDTNERKQTEVLLDFTGTPVSSPANDKPNRPTGSQGRGTDTRRFIPATATAAAATTSPPGRRQLPNVKVLVMTDLGSRGIDTVMAKHVVLYDVPHTSIDFIHRLGRVGRMGRRGRAFVLVAKGDRRDIVREVREGMFKGQALI